MENLEYENQNYSEFIGFIDALSVIIIILLLAFFAVLAHDKSSESKKTEKNEALSVKRPESDSTIVFRDLKKRVLFDLGSATITEDFQYELDNTLVAIHKNFQAGTYNFVEVVGHTDKKPILPNPNCQIYIDNWDLGAARAAAVVRYFTDTSHFYYLNPRQISAVSFGEFQPVSKQSSPEGDAQNRRIEIILMKK